MLLIDFLACFFSLPVVKYLGGGGARIFFPFKETFKKGF